MSATRLRLSLKTIIVAVVTMSCMLLVAFACIIPYATWMWDDYSARNRLEAARQTIPAIQGDVLIQQAAGKAYGGVLGCVSYHIEEVRATNDLSMAEVLTFYSGALPSNGWRPENADEKYGVFTTTGDVRLDIAAVNNVYHFRLHPFMNFGASENPMLSDIAAIREAQATYRTVFTLSLLTLPYHFDERCRG